MTAALFVPIAVCSRTQPRPRARSSRTSQVIEATIAYRKTPQKQPQKKFDQPDVVKPEGVSHDENKKVEPQKDEKKPKDRRSTPRIRSKAFAVPTKTPVKPTTQPGGDFNGSEKGFAPESKGDPFFGRLRGDMNFTVPGDRQSIEHPRGLHSPPTRWQDRRYDVRRADRPKG